MIKDHVIYVSDEYNSNDFKTDRVWRVDGIYEPFVYVIKEKDTGVKYIGCRTKYSGKPCLESDLGQVYFTSSDYIQWKSEEFEILEIIKCASNHDAQILENNLICLYDAVKSDLFYNKSMAGFSFNTSGIKMNESTRSKLREIQLGRVQSLEERTKRKESLEKFYSSELSYEVKKNRSINMIGELNPFYGKTHGDNHPKGMLGKSHTEENKQKFAESSRNRVWSEESKKKLSDSKKGENNPMYGIVRSKEHSSKISKATKGKKRSEEAKQRIKEGAKKRVKKYCEHCDKSFDPGPFKRYHGDNCKKKP